MMWPVDIIASLIMTFHVFHYNSTIAVHVVATCSFEYPELHGATTDARFVPLQSH